MDLRFTPEELAFRDEVRAFFRANLPDEYPQQAGRGQAPRQGRHRHLAAHPQRQGLGGGELAGRMGRHRLDPGSAIHLPGRAAADPGAAAARLWRHDGRAGHDRVRHGGAEEALSAAHRQSRRLVVPGLFRAGCGLGPRLAADRRQARRRPLHRQRAEDLDHPGAARRLDLLPGAHRSRRRRSRRGSRFC